jgi:hypothetical protein
MISLFDKFNLYEIPLFVLCNPSKEELYSLGGIDNRKYKPRFNALGEISFTAYATIDGVETDYYDSLLYRKLIYLPNIGYFMITEISESNDGIVKQKDIVAKSLEVELCLKKITYFSGTYQFYDFITPSSTLLGYLLTLLPTWTIGTIDSSLTTLFRTFNVSDKTVYDFMMGEIEEAFQCVFVFDTIAKTISAYTVTSAVTATDIYLSYENIIEKINIKELTDELCTALTVRGAGNLSISTVNCLGNDNIYNFGYYKNTSWMSQNLIDAIDIWEAKILAKQGDYANLLTLLRENNETLITLNAELVDLNSDMASLVGVQGARIQQSIDYSDINVQIVAKQVEIDSKQAEIDSVNATIGIADINGTYPAGSIMAQLKDINTYVSFATNFTTLQQTELSPLIMGNTYNNENFIQTDIMTQAEIQDQAQMLYNQAVSILAKISVPRYEFSVDAVNFVFLSEFTTFVTQLVLGCSVTLELKEDLWIYPVLLGIDLNYDDPTDFALTFGNRLRLDDSSYVFSDLFGQTVNQGITTSFKSEQWTYAYEQQNAVSVFMDSALDTSKNAVISGSTQNVLIDQNGIRVRSLVSGSSTYSPEQLWLNNGILAFTDNNWNTAKLALGSINVSGSSPVFGLIADVVVGRLLAGNSLTITNQNNTFTVNGSGATLTNATLTVNTTSGKTKIFLDPTNGIKIQGLVGGSWQDKFYADSNGNVIFSGNLSGATGTFSGTLSAATISGGTITGTAINGGTISGTTGTFSGNIYADKIYGTIVDSQIAGVSANKVSAGTIFGSTVSWAGGYLGVTGTGAPILKSYGNLLLQGDSSVQVTGTSYVALTSGYSTILASSSGAITITGNTRVNGLLEAASGMNVYGNISITGYVNAQGGYYGGGYLGITQSVPYYTGSTTRYLVFRGGICTAY